MQSKNTEHSSHPDLEPLLSRITENEDSEALNPPRTLLGGFKKESRILEISRRNDSIYKNF